MGENQHVVPDGEGGWGVRREGASRLTARFPTQAEAIEAGRRIAQNQGVELIIHRPNGRIRDSDSHGRDPCPPKDRR